MNNVAVTVLELTPGDLLADGFLSALNRAALRHDPTVYLIRNDGFADGVPLPLAFANPCLVDLAPAFRLRGARIEPAELPAVLERARALCAAGRGPFLIELLVDPPSQIA